MIVLLSPGFTGRAPVSPTVSRMGMVYMGWRTLPWQVWSVGRGDSVPPPTTLVPPPFLPPQVLVDVWLRRLLTAKRRRPAEADALQGHFTRHVPRMLAYLAESATPRMALPETSRVATGASLPTCPAVGRLFPPLQPSGIPLSPSIDEFCFIDRRQGEGWTKYGLG